MRVIALAPSMEHQVEAGDYTKAVAGKGAEPRYLVRVHVEGGRFGIGRKNLFGSQRRYARLAHFYPAVRIREKTDPAKIDQSRTDRGDFPVDQGDRPFLIEQHIGPLKVAVNAADPCGWR